MANTGKLYLATYWQYAQTCGSFFLSLFATACQRMEQYK